MKIMITDEKNGTYANVLKLQMFECVLPNFFHNIYLSGNIRKRTNFTYF